MQFSILRFFVLFLCFLSFGLYAESEIQDSSTGVDFPSDVTFENNGKDFHLRATGVATRKKLFIKIYSVAHYL